MNFNVRETPGNTDWFVHDRFGMFIHWGLYSLPARHEWVMNHERITNEDYKKYFDHFDPDLYDPKEWAAYAKKAGMKYAVLTTKHHEGFCLFDSEYTDFKATNTKAGRDLVKEYVDAFRAEGIKIGFYYSLLDWHHPDFTTDYHHPRRDDTKEEIERFNKGRDMKRYAQYIRDQVTELLTNYGKIDLLWFDFSYVKGKDDWESEKLIKLIRSIQPEIIINNRLGIDQDIWTPEQYQPEEWITDDKGQRVVWEGCQTFSGSWGYHRDEKTWKSPEQLIKMLINSVACGGNLIMNVGPTSRGYFDKRAVNALDVYAEWMKYNSKSIYGCTQSEFTTPNDARYTQNGKMLYLHIFSYPFINMTLKGMAGKIEYMQFLHDGSEIIYKEQDGDVQITLPVEKPDVTVPVVEIFLK